MKTIFRSILRSTDKNFVAFEKDFPSQLTGKFS